MPLAGEAALDAAMRYTLEAGGKRIRPALCLAAAQAGGAEADAALPAAAAVELVHTFSLIHDDLPALDDDAERRGRPSSHVRYGEAVAILAGDGLLNAAYRLVAERLAAPAEVRLAVIEELAAGVAGMIEGQFLDVTSAAPDAAGLDRLQRLKTGALISCAVGCGLHVAGLDSTAQAPFRDFAAELGVLFQITDDILDAGADEPSSVTVHGLEGARREAAAARERALELLAACPGDTARLRELTVAVADRSG